MIYRSRGALIASIFFLFSGISTGVFIELAMDDSDKMIAAQFLNQYLHRGNGQMIDYPNPFLYGAMLNLLLLFIMMISGFVSFGFPVAYAVLVYKGLALGFSAGLLIESFVLDGIVSVLIALVPQNVILIPVYVVAAATAQAHALSHSSGNGGPQAGAHKNGRNHQNGFSRYIMHYMFLAFGIICACLLESIIYPLLQV